MPVRVLRQILSENTVLHIELVQKHLCP